MKPVLPVRLVPALVSLTLPFLANCDGPGVGDREDVAKIAAPVLAPSRTAYKTNSLIKLPSWNYLADVNGDGSTDIIQAYQQRLFVQASDPPGTGISHYYFDAQAMSIFVGSFRGQAQDDVCAQLNNGNLQCISLNASGAFHSWLKQRDFIVRRPTAPQYRIIVGDFDADGRDDLLLHDATATDPAIAVKLYTYDSVAKQFVLMPGFSPAPMGSQVRSASVYAGAFSDPNRDDIVVHFPTTGVLSYYQFNAATHGFDQLWQSAAGAIHPQETVSPAKINASGFAALALFDQSTGATRFMKPQIDPATGGILPLVGISTGQLPQLTAAGSRIFYAKLGRWPGELGTEVRDDAFAYDAGSGALIRYDARWDGSQLTYWWAFTKSPLRHDLEGWPAMVYRRWLVLLCKFNDVTTEPHDRSWYDALFTNNDDGEANPGMYNFFKDVSYGAENNLPTEIHGWYTMGLQSQPFGVLYRSVPGQACVQAAGIDTSAYAKIITVFNAPNDSGFDGGAVEGDSGTDQGFFAHELGHAYGLHHAFDDSPRSCGAAPGEYCDGYDTMGNEYYSFWSMFGHSGPAYSLPERRALGWVPAGREMLLMGQATPQTQTVQIASSSRPESNGALLVRVRPPYSTDDTHYFSIELTQRDNGFYQAIPRDGIVIREYTGATPRPPAFGEPGQNAWTSYLKAWGRDDNWGRPPDVLVGETYTSDVMTVTPLSIDSAGGFATVQITY